MLLTYICFGVISSEMTDEVYGDVGKLALRESSSKLAIMFTTEMLSRITVYGTAIGMTFVELQKGGGNARCRSTNVMPMRAAKTCKVSTNGWFICSRNPAL